VHNHSLFDFGYAGSHQVSGPFDFDYANPAGTDLMDIFQVAEMRDEDVVLLGSFENGGSLFGLNGFIVDGKCYK
jgi:hypothetical protein